MLSPTSIIYEIKSQFLNPFCFLRKTIKSNNINGANGQVGSGLGNFIDGAIKRNRENFIFFVLLKLKEIFSLPTAQRESSPLYRLLHRRGYLNTLSHVFQKDLITSLGTYTLCEELSQQIW